MNMGNFALKADAAIVAGTPLVIECKDAMNGADFETVLDPKMRGRVVGIMRDNYEGVKLVVDLTDFMDSNAPYERATWYGPNDSLVKARETSSWPHNNQEFVWFHEDTAFDTYFEIISGGNELFDEYQASGFGGSYISWLEATVIRQRSG